MNQINQIADTTPNMLRISVDAKATVKIGPFSRRGKSRGMVKASDHDFQPDGTLTPVGIFLPAHDQLFLYWVTSKVTSDCLADRLHQWWETVRHRFAYINTLVINLYNGPENHSRPTQFMHRIVEFVNQYHLNVRLACYPPYHSKYNPIERCWGILENHWNGSLLDSVDTVLEFAKSLTWKGKHPMVELATKTYQTGVKLGKEAMADIEAQTSRLPQLEKWFVDIVYRSH